MGIPMRRRLHKLGIDQRIYCREKLERENNVRGDRKVN